MPNIVKTGNKEVNSEKLIASENRIFNKSEMESFYFCDPKQIRGLMLIGEVEIVTDVGIKNQLWRDDWKIHYPSGVDGPEYNILRLSPMYVKCWFVPMPEPVEFKLK